jgi:large subunit ribosomal protein L21
MFAIIRTGGKQYRVAAGDVIRVEKLAGEAGDVVSLGDVLMLGGDEPKTGGPTIDGASVAAEVVTQTRGDKIIVFKRKRRKGYRRTRGHRQLLTELRITEILTDGKQPSKKAKAEAVKTETVADKGESEAKPAKAEARDTGKAEKAETKSAKPAKDKAKKADKPKADKKPAKAKKDD